MRKLSSTWGVQEMAEKFSNRRLILASLVAVALAWGCQKEPPTEQSEPVAERIECSELGLAIAALPPYFRVAVHREDALELAPAAADGTGRLAVVVGEAEEGGINLIAAIEEHQAEILARPGGDFKGQRELASQLGTTFYSRGRYDSDEGVIEETMIFAIHPWGDRILRLVYRYPAGEDTRERLEDQLFEVLGEIEALPMPPQEATG